jgi:hypothetical protein
MVQNKWIEFMKDFRARPENSGMSQTEMMHYGSLEYKAGKGEASLETEGGKLNLKKVFKKAKKHVKKADDIANKASKTLEKNQVLVDMAVGKEKSAQLTKAVNQATKVTGTANDMSNESTAQLLARVQKAQESHQEGGKFKLKRALRKAKHTVHTATNYAIPIAGMVAPELEPALIAANVATGGGVKIGRGCGCKGSMVGGSFRGPKSSGGAIHSSEFIGEPVLNNYSPFIGGRNPRPKPPSLKNRAQSVE